MKKTDTSNTTKYYAAAIAAFAIWGFFSFALMPLQNYPSLDILFYRVFFSTVLMLLITAIFRRRTFNENVQLFRKLAYHQKKKSVLLNIGGGIFLTSNWFFFIYVMNHISIKATSLAYLVCPILTALLAFFVLKEKLNKYQRLAIGLSIGGCLLLALGNMLDMLYSLVVGLSYALYLVSQRRNAGFDKLLVLTFHFVISAVLLLPLYPFFSARLPTSADFYSYTAIISVVFTIIPLFLNLYALKALTSSTVGMLLSINPLIGFTIAVIVFHEPVNAMQLTGYAVVFAAVVIFNIRVSKSVRSGK
ncbi:EamA family transporter [Mucilaginibacter hurinus]|uniref:EamA family transporter n=1 Tax=Mucilaginibacter hurinus TaxID=2201324 RepID=UPI0018F571DE|nr:EamA family transporter [Mucilaginibacter hurinus]